MRISEIPGCGEEVFALELPAVDLFIIFVILKINTQDAY